MSYSSCLNETRDDLVLDTSVFINLSGSRACGQILSALPNRVLMTREVSEELVPDIKRERDDRAILEAQINASRIEIIELGAAGRERFEQLISDPERPLGDGEAATIAAAEERGLIAVIDEKRARSLMPDERLASSVDLFAHEEVAKQLGGMRQGQATYNALTHARMAVQENQRDWAIETVGKERAARCNSLPRHKDFLQEIEKQGS